MSLGGLLILSHVGGVHYSWCGIASPRITATYFYYQRDCELVSMVCVCVCVCVTLQCQHICMSHLHYKILRLVKIIVLSLFLFLYLLPLLS